MKKLVWFLGTIGLITTTSVFAAEEVNFQAANPVLQTLVDAVISADDTVDFAYPKFDAAASKLKTEKLKYDLQGALKNTPWLEGGKADIVGTSSYSTDRTAGHTGINVSMSSTVSTNTLAFVRYAALIAYKKTYIGSEFKFRARFEGHLKRLAVASSLDEVYDLLLSGQALSKEMAAWDIQKEVDYLNCLLQGGCSYGGMDLPAAIVHQKRTIENKKVVECGVQQVKIETQSESGKVRRITVTSTDMSLFTKNQNSILIEPLMSVTTLTDDTVSASAKAFAPKSSERLDELKAKLQERLIGAQNGNADQKEKIENSFREGLIQFKKVIQGEY